jgi:hypothetical protein
MTRQPLRTLLLPVAALALAAAAQAFIDGANVRGIVTAVLAVLIAAATELARARVTPVADPRLPVRGPTPTRTA